MRSVSSFSMCVVSDTVLVSPIHHGGMSSLITRQSTLSLSEVYILIKPHPHEQEATQGPFLSRI